MGATARSRLGQVLTARGLREMIGEPTSAAAARDVYTGGLLAIRALNDGCYPALGHFVANHYSARFDVHQGSCSGVLCARIMAHHQRDTAPLQACVSSCIADATCSTLHFDAGRYKITAPIVIRT